MGAGAKQPARQPELTEGTLAQGWLEQFLVWLEDAVRADLPEPYAMVLATATPEGATGVRSVLLRGVSETGMVFHTNYGSRKAGELAANSSASLLFPWYALNRQVVVDGRAERLTAAESDAYWEGRPYESKLSALASPQSRVIQSRDALLSRRDALLAEYPQGTTVPRPPHWGGFRVVPHSVEFWQARPSRLHDRLRYRLDSADRWTIERLAP